MAIRRFIVLASFFAFMLYACSSATQIETPTPVPPTDTATATATITPTATVAPTATPVSLVPNFEHIAIVIFENKEFGTVFVGSQMAYFQNLAKTYTLLTQHYAITHPSLPNYLALISGDTQGVTFDCTSCLYDAPSLPDLIEASGRTWKTYQEDMPAPCYPNPESGNYAIKHNPFMYFKAIRLNKERCANSIVPLSQLSVDIAAGTLPNFMFITPNLCNDAHDCPLSVTDDWLKNFMGELQPALEADGKPYLLILTWDEGQGKHSCCGIPEPGGGRIATILISPQAKSGFSDDTPYNHYSILKTIEESWHLQYIGHSADDVTPLIVAPWKW